MIGLIFRIGFGYSRTDWDDILEESEGIDSSTYNDEQLEVAITNAFENGNLTNYVKSVYPEYFDMPYFQLGWWNTDTQKEYYKEIWTNESNS